MTPSPKEKAKELLDKFYVELKEHIGYYDIEIAKQCSIITVNKILEALPIKKLSDAELYDYLVTVKTELENTN
jgi:hypothetical protein